MKTETRFFKVDARKRGALGRFEEKIFELTVTVTGSYHAMCEEATKLINEQGYEVNFIRDHSYKRSLL